MTTGFASFRAAHAVHPIAALQSEYSLWTRDVEAGILDACRDLGIAFVAYSPLGRGFLTGTIPDRSALHADDWRRGNPRFSDEALSENARYVELLGEIAGRKGATGAQVALASVLAQGQDILAIPGTRRIERLREDLGACDVQLTAEELAEVRSRLPQVTAGSRY